MTKSILVVDDNDDIRTLATLSLGHVGGHEVRGAASGAECLAILAEWRPDVIVMDVRMPGMDGPELLSHVREDPATADVPVVFLTASVVAQELDVLRRLPVAGVLEKPFDPLTLPAQLGEMLGW